LRLHQNITSGDYQHMKHVILNASLARAEVLEGVERRPTGVQGDDFAVETVSSGMADNASTIAG
jgi:hypothetical protein